MRTHISKQVAESIPPTDPLEAVALGECFLYEGQIYMRTRLVRTTHSSYVQVNDGDSPVLVPPGGNDRRAMVIRLEDGHQAWLLTQEMVRPVELVTADYTPKEW